MFGGKGLPRLAHGWRLGSCAGLRRQDLRDLIRPALRAAPRPMARRLGPCLFSFAFSLDDPDAASRWVETDAGVEVSIATEDMTPHDIALEMLVCLGQVLWTRLRRPEYDAWLRLLAAELDAGVAGEIDEEAYYRKSVLLLNPESARHPGQIGGYARAAFAASAAEYVHALWHDVTLRNGREHLDAERVRARLRLFERWFPPNPGFRLFGRLKATPVTQAVS